MPFKVEQTDNICEVFSTDGSEPLAVVYEDELQLLTLDVLQQWGLPREQVDEDEVVCAESPITMPSSLETTTLEFQWDNSEDHETPVVNVSIQQGTSVVELVLRTVGEARNLLKLFKVPVRWPEAGLSLDWLCEQYGYVQAEWGGEYILNNGMVYDTVQRCVYHEGEVFRTRRELQHLFGVPKKKPTAKQSRTEKPHRRQQKP